MCLSQSHLTFPLNHHTEQQLKALSNKVEDHRMRMRLLAVAHFKAGKNRAEVANHTIGYHSFHEFNYGI